MNGSGPKRLGRKQLRGEGADEHGWQRRSIPKARRVRDGPLAPAFSDQPFGCVASGSRPPRRYAGAAMSPPPATGRERRGTDVARERDARVCWLLGMHPVTAAMLVR